MPEICRFLGIIIKMYFNDHAPPHFHVQYGSQEAMINIEGLNIIKGSLSPRIFGLVMEWASLHQDELREDWVRAQGAQQLLPIQPLE